MRVKVRVIPRAKKERIELSVEVIRVYLCQPPREGKANKRLIEVLAEYYHTPKGNITIIKGEKQRDKIVEVPGEITRRKTLLHYRGFFP